MTSRITTRERVSGLADCANRYIPLNRTRAYRWRNDEQSGIMNRMDTTLPPLIAALMQPQRHAPGVQQVELLQTHISWVLLAGDVVYKIKKPVKLPFLDFSTLSLRHQFCLDELRLNRRFAPDIYLDVVALYNTPDNPQWEGSGPPIEYAVKMRRFDEVGRLDRVSARHELLPSHLSDLADTVLRFHEGAAVAPPDSGFASPEKILAQAQDNFDELLQLLPQPDVTARLKALQTWSDAQFSQLEPLMAARKQAGWVRECHGDLHLANMVLIDGRVRLFDCIEFNDDLRWIDVASDIAFAYVDLLAHGQSGLANWLVNEVLSRNGDYAQAPLLRFYAVYRALVRAKVAAIRLQQTHTDDREAMADIALAQALVTKHPLRLLITHGLSGCGKTYVTDRLLQSDAQPPTLRLRADVERKHLFGLADQQRSGSAMNAGIYTPAAHSLTYGYLREQAHLLLHSGWSVVVDATFLKRADRDVFRALAAELGAGFVILAPQASNDQLRQRITARHALGTDASEATLEVLEHQLRELEPLGADEGGVLSVAGMADLQALNALKLA
ncbi:AAA family ATPase [Rhodoferax sp.]|uniref:bifunctional aminoglycoside phosphotransferase/ATP-binding protein n=1 Tax=Rhodoferax sp. TaxID=50421 RepID=UPI00285037A3|nr:AAA family ATPase [Rhodoferax sp.]MDR3367980.1 AAA family ATPase [Rhodoferax sp.]